MAKHRKTLLKSRGLSLRSAKAGPQLIARMKAGASIHIHGGRLVLNEKQFVIKKGLVFAPLIVVLTAAVFVLQAYNQESPTSTKVRPCIDDVSIGMALPKSQLVSANVVNLGGVSQVRLKDPCSNQNLLLTLDSKTDVIIGLRKI